MLSGSRSVSVPALLIAGTAGLTYFGASMAPRPERDGIAPSAVPCPFGERSLTDEEIERRQQIYLQRIADKDRAVRDLLAGRLTLVQAAARFRDVEEEQPVTWWPRNAATVPADGERLCRVVMDRASGWVEVHLPTQTADVTARLEAELEQHRSQDGTVRLPD